MIMKATQTADGQWRSIESKRFYQIQLEVGQPYRSILAKKSRDLGYTPVVTRSGEGISFEFKEVPQGSITQFSSRSVAIEAYLAERGWTRKSATAEQQQEAALATRKGKELIDTAELRAHGQSQVKDMKLDIPAPPKAPVKLIDVDAAIKQAKADGSLIDRPAIVQQAC